MGLKVIFLLAVCLLGIFAYEDLLNYEGASDEDFLNKDCILCMCEVLGYTRRTTCFAGQPQSCGPFHITYGYWQTAFNEDDNKHEEFRNCTLSPSCAVRTVQNHMRRGFHACVKKTHPKDPRSVCEMAMVLHIFGHSKCNTTNEATERYSRGIRECMDRRTWNWLLTDMPKK